MAETDNNDPSNSDGQGSDNSTPNTYFTPFVATGGVIAKTTGKVSKSLTRTVTRTTKTATNLGKTAKAAAAKAEALSSRAKDLSARAEASSNFLTRGWNNIRAWFGNREATAAEKTASKLASKATKAESIAGKAAAFESETAGVRGILGKAGWVATLGFAALDIYHGYKANGWKGAASAAIDTVAVAAPAMMAADVGAGIGAALGTVLIPIPGVGTAIGGFVGGLAAGWFAGHMADKYALPLLHKAEAWVGLPAGDQRTQPQQKQVQQNGQNQQNPNQGQGPAQPSQTASTPAAPSETIAAAQKGDALSTMMHEIAEARRTRSHAKINMPDGETVDFDGSQNGQVSIEVDGHVDAAGVNSARSEGLAKMRADQAAYELASDATAEGLDITDIKITAKADGVGQGQSATQQRNTTFKFLNATV